MGQDWVGEDDGESSPTQLRGFWWRPHPFRVPGQGPLHKRREPLALTLEILSPGQPKVEVGDPERAHRKHLPREAL